MENLLNLVKSNKYWVIGIVGALLVGYGVGVTMSQMEGSPEVQGVAEQVQDESVSGCEIYVDISGAVVTPDVYCLPQESIVNDVLELAGGLNGKECTSWVSKQLNRAQVIQEGQKLFIPSSSDELCINSPIISEKGKISINNSKQEELESLPGVGPSIAEKIISGRPYSTLEDLMKVSGIGEGLFTKIENLIAL